MSGPRATNSAASAGAGVSVLVVDDEPFMCKVAVAMLKTLGHDAQAVGSGEEAVELVTREPARFDCALVDLSMLPMDGLACVKALKAFCPSMAVYIMTGYNMDDEAAMLRAHGVAAVLQKPLTLGLLRDHIRPAAAHT